MANTNLIQIAVIGAAHGIKGEVRVKTFTGDPLAIGDYGALETEDGRFFTVAQVRPSKEVVIVRFKGVETRNDAEALNGTTLFVDRAKLPDDLEEDEFYHVDLIGLAVQAEDGEQFGTIIAVHDFGAGEMLEVKARGEKPVLVPFTRAAVPVIDIKGGFVQVEPVAAGLVGDEDEEGAGREEDER
ncbi:ribosome maturation factor RimM [Tianweitania sp. BSSL-BM11]|uniref:Ribosome maturation factor RimM n=1 Tax=Tianweitania aestuarii TaxID=2814886 RepID=A0ABS5RYY9_9HYPH|nr:ribosome maturation factor RimM [Tianweitania aestuarii]MBS9722265.1 ribosome maturation factor RimM [Tianweitania aestuarii]